MPPFQHVVADRAQVIRAGVRGIGVIGFPDDFVRAGRGVIGFEVITVQKALFGRRVPLVHAVKAEWIERAPLLQAFEAVTLRPKRGTVTARVDLGGFALFDRFKVEFIPTCVIGVDL